MFYCNHIASLHKLTISMKSKAKIPVRILPAIFSVILSAISMEVLCTYKYKFVIMFVQAMACTIRLRSSTTLCTNGPGWSAICPR